MNSSPFIAHAPGVDGLYRCLCRLLSTPRAGEYPFLDELDEAGWDSLISLAKGEGVAPLLYAKFQAAGWPAEAPARACTMLAGDYYRSAACYSLLRAELERILNALAEADVRVLVLKGMSLAGRLYPDPALRPMSDLDLLIPAEQVGTAVGCIESCGYRVQKSSYHVVLWGGPGEQVNVELHWSLTPGQTGEASENCSGFLWGNTQPLEVLPGQVLSCEADLLYLSAHLILQHGGRPRLIWLYDLHLLLTAQAASLDWPALFQRAEELGWEAPLAAALSLVQECLGSPLPAACELLCARTDPLVPMGFPEFQAWSRAALHSLPFSLRMRFLKSLLFPKKAYMLWRYQPQPAWLWPFYYLERLATLFHQAAFNRMRRGA